MNNELSLKLFEDFPILYQQKVLSPQHSLMCFGFSCGDGWYSLIRELSEKIEGYNGKNPDSPIVAVQVKEKFGALRFYVDHSSGEVETWIREAEAESSMTCERCGEPGKLRGNGWLRTLCDDCWEEK